MKVISIEGNIGSGKSTLVQALKKTLQSNKICFLDEPIDVWNTIVDEDGKTMLENYYKDSKKYAFSFQMMAYISRLSVLKKASETYDVIITERSLYTDKHVFCQMLYDDQMINHLEYTIYNKWFEEFNISNPIHYVYLKTDPVVSCERVMKRNRHGETIPLLYLEKCHMYHEKWLGDKNPLIIDANAEVSPEYVKQCTEQIKRLIS